ncbi:MAG TPA: hypothetical protein VLH10_14495 [Yinghuangia sp.]|uniref:hypothetical protein n=1 Tax=Yinghuangia sp. YIM S10712 TaxID=3436930 RepID=UPI002B9D5A79|nr:hypothetical protein [Yinghuangia sp.]
MGPEPHASTPPTATASVAEMFGAVVPAIDALPPEATVVFVGVRNAEADTEAPG